MDLNKSAKAGRELKEKLMNKPIDQCDDCKFKGDFKGCIETTCTVHNSWHNQMLRMAINKLKDENTYLEKLINYLNKSMMR